MDEIFDRIKTIKIKKKKLFIPLILTELLGILVLVWFLRVPLTGKYLTIAPNNYSVDSMDQSTQYIIRQGDIIAGKTIPNSTLQVLLYPNGSQHDLLTDSTGNFTFQIPRQTPLAVYRLIIINDRIDNRTAIKDLRIRVISSNKLDWLLQLIKLPPV